VERTPNTRDNRWDILASLRSLGDYYGRKVCINAEFVKGDPIFGTTGHLRRICYDPLTKKFEAVGVDLKGFLDPQGRLKKR
jgi:hypothetical protein